MARFDFRRRTAPACDRQLKIPLTGEILLSLRNKIASCFEQIRRGISRAGSIGAGKGGNSAVSRFRHALAGLHTHCVPEASLPANPAQSEVG
jgi:hypothetical protein